ncbi:uncharacterized protein PgNI_00683 [Pyricularia grisea]|uniref:Uncharacterized protein n=1 Tax=Pyricularia grisea TaxID=148305 RepID=A0A6P8BIB3_PYRGI|nr:uncharacterized protein PgNI_00683 [Pyricularia grisea]TLD16621.1 hypothetical protein PgNI_00683 [Pyricularia grisea]
MSGKLLHLSKLGYAFVIANLIQYTPFFILPQPNGDVLASPISRSERRSAGVQILQIWQAF